jgi:hypothetical protein
MLSSFADFLGSLSARAWAELVGAALIALGTGCALDWYQSGQAATWSPRIESAEEMHAGDLSGDEWAELLVHDVPVAPETTTVVVPRDIAKTDSSQNGLTEVTYAADLIDTPELSGKGALPPLPFVVVPVSGKRPAVDLTPEEVTLSAVNPRTGGGLTYTYDVPRDTWAIDVEGTITAGQTSLASTATVGLRYERDAWSARVGAGYAAGVVGESAAAGPVGAVTLQYEIGSFDLLD